MKIIPFAQVGIIAFGIGHEALITIMGQPHSQRPNLEDQMEFDYGSVIYRFDPSSTLVEISLDAPVMELHGHLIPFPFLAGYVREQDLSAFERTGFLVSPRFGIAHDPNYPSWLTVFPHASTDLWRAMGNSPAGA